MIENTILALTISLQISAALLAIRLFWREGRSRAWILVTLLFSAIGLRRSAILLTTVGYSSRQTFVELGGLFLLALCLLFGVFALHYFIKRLETMNKTLRENEFIFRSMVENLPGAVYRGKAGEDRAMLYISDGIELLTGYPAEGFIDNKERSFASIIHGKDLSSWYSRQKYVDNKEAYEIQYRLLRADDHTIYVREKGTGVWDDNGNLLWLNGFIWDVTANIKAEETRLSLERQVQHTQKLKSLGVLAGGVAHDFNNLLMAILGHTELALLEMDDKMPAQESVHHIQKSSQRAADLCKQLLAYSGRGAFEIKRIRLHTFVAEMLDFMKTSVSKKATLNINLPEELPPVSGDAAQLTQVIMNLVTNASDAIGNNKGAINVTGSLLKSEASIPSGAFVSDDMPHGRYICIEIADTGCGMNLETMDRIFEPFFTTKVTGRGLGMAAVMGIVHSHRGALWLTSEEGVGTTFRVYLPAAKKEGHSTTFMTREQADVWKGSGLVLLVDDEPELRVVCEKMLHHIGFDVITASNGQEAIEKFKEQKTMIEAVLLDLTMPDMDGEEVFRELRGIDPNVKVIVVSGFSLQEIEERFQNVGLLGALHKPFSLKELKKTLRSHLEDSTPDDIIVTE